ncbi:hypothetical protein BJ742DRAFT_839714 [Cladochytrium replicatum]|nr:hypothetical protein BJ742DRAFT_839714 [Cladochytrium replicatum]
MSFSAEKIPDLSGKVAIVTGGNTGIGFATVKSLAAKNAKVYLAARSPALGLAAIEEIKREIPNARLEYLELDLSSIRATKDAAIKFVNSNEPLHILINNAGVGVSAFELTNDGIERTFAVNHVGHFVFTTTLLPALERAGSARVVNVSSYMHLSTPSEGILFNRINNPNIIDPTLRYNQSKLANILFTKALAARLAGKPVWVNAIDPGSVQSGILRGLDAMANNKNRSWLIWLIRPFWFLIKAVLPLFLMTPANGALTQLYAATSPEIEANDFRGQYIVPFGKLGKLSKAGKNHELSERLWEYSEKLVAENL